MDIAALSMSMAQHNVSTEVGVAMLSKSLDLSATVGDTLSSMIDRAGMEQSVTPYIGANFDMSV